MNSLTANFINETQKMLLKSKVWACFIISAIIPVGVALLIALLHNKAGVLAVGPAGFPIFILGLFTSTLLPLFIFMWTADIFAGEVGDRSLKVVMVRPISRFKIYLSKIMALGLSTVLLLAVILIFTLISSILLGGNGHEYLSGVSGGLIAYTAAIVPMLSLAIAASFIAQFLKSSSGALTTSIFVYIAARLLPVVLPSVSKVSLFSYTNWHEMWLGSLAAPEKLLYAFLVMLSSCIILFTLGYYLFDTKEL
jgi:ABC-2 type transport system permease protein